MTTTTALNLDIGFAAEEKNLQTFSILNFLEQILLLKVRIAKKLAEDSRRADAIELHLTQARQQHLMLTLGQHRNF